MHCSDVIQLICFTLISSYVEISPPCEDEEAVGIPGAPLENGGNDLQNHFVLTSEELQMFEDMEDAIQPAGVSLKVSFDIRSSIHFILRRSTTDLQRQSHFVPIFHKMFTPPLSLQGK